MVLEKTVRDIKYEVLKTHEIDIPQKIGITHMLDYWSKGIVVVPGVLPNTRAFSNTVKRLNEKKNIKDKRTRQREIKKFGKWLFNKSSYPFQGDMKKLDLGDVVDAVNFSAIRAQKSGAKSIIVVPGKFHINTEKRNEMEKNINYYHKLNTHKPIEKLLVAYLHNKTNKEILETLIDSSVVNNFVRNPTAKLSQELITKLRITPGKLAKQIGRVYNDSKRLGYSFKTLNGENLAVSWINLYKAQMLGEKGILTINKEKESISNKKIYANAKDIIVKNNQNGMKYEVTFRNIPLVKTSDASKYVQTWQLNFSSHSPDSRFKGDFHKKQVEGLMYATKHIIFGYNYLADKFSTHNDGDNLFVWADNPFLTPNYKFGQFAESAMNILTVSYQTPQNVELSPSNEALVNFVLNEKIINTGIKKLIL